MCGVLQKEERIILLWFPISLWHQFSPCSKTAFWDLFGHLSDKSRPFSQHCWVQFSALKCTSYFLAHTLLYSGRYFPLQSPHVVTFILDGFKPVWNVQLWKIWPELGRHESTSSELNLERRKCSETGDLRDHTILSSTLNAPTRKETIQWSVKANNVVNGDKRYQSHLVSWGPGLFYIDQ